MGMDVIGKAPLSPEGEYFRNNVWWWHDLWQYCQTVSNAAAVVQDGHYNSGAGLDEDRAVELANDLQARLDSGHTAEYEAAFRAKLDSVEDEDCKLCRGTGSKDDGQMCQICNGKGKVRPTETWYRFSEDNVRRFVAFLRASGGFEIW